MEENEGLTKEVKRLNDKIDELKSSGKFMIYSANPFKFAFFNFLAGIFNTLGALFGYLVIFGALVYFLSRVNLGQLMGRWIENTMSQVRWEKVMPIPKTSN